MGLEVTGNTSERGNIAEVLGECLIWELLQGSTMSWARTCPVLIPGLLPSATAAKDPATVLELVRGAPLQDRPQDTVSSRKTHPLRAHPLVMTIYLFQGDKNVI